MGTMSQEEIARVAQVQRDAVARALALPELPREQQAEDYIFLDPPSTTDLGPPTRHVYRCNKGHVWEESCDPLLILPAQIVRVSNLPGLDGVYCLRCLLEPLGKVECVE